MAASQNSMVSPSGVGRSKRTVLMRLFPGSGPAPRPWQSGMRPGIDPRRRIGHAATNLTPASTFRAPGGPATVLMDDHLARMAEEFGDRTAFAVVDVGSLTFAEWDGAANAMARRLLEAGLEPGGRVGIHLRPELALHWLISYSAAHRAGGVAVPMNPRLAPAEVAHMLEHSGRHDRGGRWRPAAERRRGRGGPPRHPDRRRRGGRDGAAGQSRCSRGARPPPGTARRSRRRASPRTWPTSSTPRGRPAGPRAWPCATPTGP